MFVFVVSLTQPSRRDFDYPLWDVRLPGIKKHQC